MYGMFIYIRLVLIVNVGKYTIHGSFKLWDLQMGVFKNNGTPESSILIGFSIINHPFWGTRIFGNIQIYRIFDIAWLFGCTDPWLGPTWSNRLTGDISNIKGPNLPTR